jgi:phosphoglycolate phosphatase-like HAD superfamily hydrolase
MCCWSPIKNCFIPDETIPNFKPLVCIDFDGTLADGDSLVNALDQISISRYYFPIDFPKANNFIGLQGREAGPREQLLDEAIRAMQLANGMEEMIVALHRKGAELIIVSDNIDVIVDRFLQAKGIR